MTTQTVPRTLGTTLAVFLLALAVHGVVAWQYRADPFATTYVADALSYDRWATRITEHGLGAEPVFHQSPLFPMLLASTYSVTAEGGRALLAASAQIALNSLALALLVPLGRLYCGSTSAGLAGALLALAYGPIVFYGLKLFPVPLALVTQAVAMIALALARRGGKPLPALAAGVCLGIACLARAEILLFVPLAALALALPLSRRERGTVHWRLVPAGLFIGGIAVCLAPVTLHNHRHGDRVLIASSSGENLFIGNQVSGHGGYSALHPQAADLFSQRALARLGAEQHFGRSLRPSEISAYWRGRALEEIRTEPLAWLGLELRKLRRILHPGDPSDVYSFALERSLYLSALWVLPASSWCVLLLGIAGASIASKKTAATAWPLALLAAVHIAILLVFFVDSRLRLPLLYFLSPFGGLAIVEAVRAWTDRRRRGLVLAACGATLAATIAGGLLTRWTDRDVVRLASVLSIEGRLDESLEVLDPLVSGPDADPIALDQAGWVLQKQGNFAAARDRYLRAIAVGLSPLRELQTRTRLASVYERLGQLDQAAAQHAAAVEGGQANAGTYYERGMFRLRRGQREAAVEDLRRAWRLDPAWPEPAEALRRLGETPH